MSWFSEGIFRLEKKEEVKPIAFTVRLSDIELLHKIDGIAKKSNYTRNELINLILHKFSDEVEIADINNQENERIAKNYNQLDRILKKHINKEIKIALNKNEHGNERIFYKLLDYSLSLKKQQLIVKFIGQDAQDFKNAHTISFENIYDFVCEENLNMYRVWIYTLNGNYRFHLK